MNSKVKISGSFNKIHTGCYHVYDINYTFSWNAPKKDKSLKMSSDAEQTSIILPDGGPDSQDLDRERRKGNINYNKAW